MAVVAQSPGLLCSLGGDLAGRVSVPAGTAVRLPILYVADTSNSVNRQGRLGELDGAVRASMPTVVASAELRRSAELALVTFGQGGVRTRALRPGMADPVDGGDAFVAAVDAVVPALEAGESTPLGEAVERAIDLCAQRVARLRAEAQQRYRPNVWVFTDGEPTDERGFPTGAWRGVLPRLRAAERAHQVLLFAVGLRGANAEVLAELAPESHFLGTNVDLAGALVVALMSSARTAHAVDGPPTDAYARVREILGVDAGGELR